MPKTTPQPIAITKFIDQFNRILQTRGSRLRLHPPPWRHLNHGARTADDIRRHLSTNRFLCDLVSDQPTHQPVSR